MIKFIWSLFCAFIFSHLTIYSQGTMRVDGALINLVCSGAPDIVLNNMNLANNASSIMFVSANSDFHFLGNQSSSISSTGAYSTVFYNTILNKSGGAEVDVVTDNMTLTTSNILTMTSGNVDMNNNFFSTWILGTSTINLGTLSRTIGHFYRGFFQRWYSIATPGLDVAQWDIPVGMNAGSYNYARVYYPSATSGGTIRTMFNSINSFYTGMPMVDSTDLVSCPGAININNCANEGYWIMMAGNGMDLVSPYTVKLNYSNFLAPTAEQCLRIIKSETLSSWMQEGVHGTFNGITDWVTRDGQTGFPGAVNTTFFTIAGDVLVNPLPVELIAFNASCVSSSVIINWTTASETWNSHFVIERSKDMLIWEFVAMVNSLNGNSNIVQEYNYEDNVYGGVFYYRLTQVDINGESETYDPITLNCVGENTGPEILNTCQNGDDQITIVLFAPTEMDYVLNLYDMLGRKVIFSNGQLIGGNNTILFNVNALSDAYYLLSIQLGDLFLNRKIFIK